ncbi:MAG: hypothetical protein V1733_03830 [bacterium]
MKKKADIPGLLFFLILFMISLGLTFLLHDNRDNLTWKGVIWADGAGYYIYLPSLFFADFEADKLPENIAEKTGNAFHLNKEQNTIQTKYFYGVSTLLSPFFISAHGIAKALNISEDKGFSPIYHRMIDVAAVVYLILGLLILKQVLREFFRPLIQYIVLLLVFTGTNLFYYSMIATSMSHIYSFFVFSLYLLALLRFMATRRWKWFLLLSVSFSLAVIIRPINGIILLLFFLWNVQTGQALFTRFSIFMKPKYLLTFLICLLIVVFPQMLYWKYGFGSFLVYSYDHEGFTNWRHPFLLEVWFAPKNGLFLNTPLAILMILGMGAMILKKIRNGWQFLFLFLLVSYLCASWYSWYFGCGFGHRCFIEYYAVFSIPLGFLLQSAWNHTRWIGKFAGGIVLLVIVYINILSSWYYTMCFKADTWDFRTYLVNLTKASILPDDLIHLYRTLDKVTITYEPSDDRSYFFITDSVYHSYSHCAVFNPSIEFCGGVIKAAKDFDLAFPTQILVNSWVLNPGDSLTGAVIVCSVEKEGRSIIWQSFEIDPVLREMGKWNEITTTFTLPEWYDTDSYIKVYCWNKHRTTFFLDDMTVKFCVN